MREEKTLPLGANADGHLTRTTDQPPQNGKLSVPVHRVVRFLRLIAAIAIWPLELLRFIGEAKNEPSSVQDDPAVSVRLDQNHRSVEKIALTPRYPEDYCFGYSRKQAQAYSETLDLTGWVEVP